MDSVINYLQEKYGIERFADQRSCIDPFSLSLPWEGRQTLLEATEQLFKQRFNARNIADRNIHTIGVVGGYPGIGKSRALLELIEPITLWHELKWTVPVIISYNNGNPPSIDRTMNPRLAFALRILYFAFIVGRTEPTQFGDSRISFENFALTMPTELRNILTPQSAIEVLSLFAKTKFGSPQGIVFLAVDEVNYLLDTDYNGESQKRALLKETMIAFGELLLSGAVFVFGVVAGTTVMPVEKIFSESSHPIRKLPIGMLSYAQCETLICRLEEREPTVWSGWKTCRAFKTLVADFASIPRKLEELLRRIRSRKEEDMRFDLIDFHDIYCELQSRVEVENSLKRYASSLVAAAILSTPVQRCSPVLPNDSDSLTYGVLEETGCIVLATTAIGLTVVQLPYSLFRKLVALLNGSDPLTIALRRACSLLTENHSEQEMISWQSFEDLHANIEAIREMLLARSRGEDTAMSVNDFYCTPHPASSAVENSLEFDLRTHCSVNTVQSRFPAAQEQLQDATSFGLEDAGGHSVDANTTIIKNAAGALFDTFTVRKTVQGGQLLVCGQQKYYQVAEVSKSLVRDEAQKVSTGLFSWEARHVLVIVATRIASDCFEEIPENCAILSGAALEMFYGPVFSGRAILAMSGTKVDINTASLLELKTVPGIGDTLARRIVNTRSDRPIRSWEDACSRVYRLPRSCEKYWSF